jgi:hypothetical protein
MASETLDCTPKFPDKNVTYDNYVKGVLAGHCTSCHQGGKSPGTGNFTTYAGVLAHADFFLSRVISPNADMPQGMPQLPKSTRDSLNIWIYNCTPEK